MWLLIPPNKAVMDLLYEKLSVLRAAVIAIIKNIVGISSIRDLCKCFITGSLVGTTDTV